MKRKPELLVSEIIKNHETVNHLANEIYEARNKCDTGKLNALSYRLNSFIHSSVVKDILLGGQLPSSVAREKTNVNEVFHKTGDSNLLLNACDELRMQFIAVSLLATNLDPSAPSYEVGTISNEASGLAHACVGDRLIFLLPPIGTYYRSDRVLEELTRLHLERCGVKASIIDFSTASECFHRSFAEGLLELQRDLLARGHSLQLCWIRKHLFLSDSFSSLHTAFRLVELGGHWFSSR